MTRAVTAENLDVLFQQAVAVIDAGEVRALEQLLAEHPRLVRERLESPGEWLTEKVGGALQGFFAKPYLLWFVAEDPVRNGKLPANIVEVTQAILRAAKLHAPQSLQEQVDYALRLVCWSWIARECSVQIALIDALVQAGAEVDGRHVYQGRFGSHCCAAIYNGNLAAAERLLQLGAPLTLTAALCLNRWPDVERLVRGATVQDKQNAFVQAALNGNAEALRRMLALGMGPTTVSRQNQSHATALHHAVWSGSPEAVRVLVEAGADMARRDTIYDGTPLGWAEHVLEEQPTGPRTAEYKEIAAYLREKGAPL